MKAAHVVGLTGGMGCGKSTAAGVLRSLGVPVLDTDAVAHEALQPGTETLDRVLAEFGAEYAVDGVLDRKKLARRVFSRPEDLARLNALVHPVVFAEMHRWIAEHRSATTGVVVMVPLLFETGAERWCDRVIVIAADEEKVLHRLAARGWSRDEALARIQAQMPLRDKIARADAVVWNNGTTEELAQAVRTAWNKIAVGKEEQP